MTVSNSNITAGSKVFGLIGDVPVYLGTSVEDGQVQVSISEDPAVIVAMVPPDAPTAVIATGVDETSARVSWTAPASNGGSLITRFTATSNSGQSCNSVTTSCVITGLTAGVSYSFTVKATNAIGDGPASSSSQPIKIGVPVVAPTTSEPAAVSGSPSVAVTTTTVPVALSGSPSVAVTTTTVPIALSGSTLSGDVTGNVSTGRTTKAKQDKEILGIAGDVLEAVKEKAAKDAHQALNSKNGKDSAGSKVKSPTEKRAQESNSGKNHDSRDNSPIVLGIFVALLLAAFVLKRGFAKLKSDN